jgi:hypothetical protein
MVATFMVAYWSVYGDFSATLYMENVIPVPGLQQSKSQTIEAEEFLLG